MRGELGFLQTTPFTLQLKFPVQFGAVVTGLDLNHVTDATVAKLREAIWRHKLVIVRGQNELEPKRNWALLQRLDPEAPKMDLDEFARSFYPRDMLVVGPKQPPPLGSPHNDQRS